jgi:hypothetical protein
MSVEPEGDPKILCCGAMLEEIHYHYHKTQSAISIDHTSAEDSLMKWSEEEQQYAINPNVTVIYGDLMS